MKVIIEIPDNLLNQVRNAVQKGDYDDPKEFVNVALANQVELETSTSGKGGVKTLEEAMDSREENPRTDESSPVDSEQIFVGNGSGSLDRTEYDLVTTVPLPDSNRLDEGPLWGQYNRIFPVKLTLRVLVNELQNRAVHATSQRHGLEGQWVSLDQFKRSASDLARDYGLKIQEVDKMEERGRGEKLSAALPIGEDAQKSKKRFKSQFVGYTEQNGDLTGATPNLAFVNITPDSRDVIGVTEPGLEFAELWNPLLDDGVGADQPFSQDEMSFYLQHVQEWLPDEYDAMQFTVEAILNGDDRPDSLSSRISTLNEEWSDAQASTVRSGLIGRMFELGLVDRRQVGQRGVAYEITESGKKLLIRNQT